MTERQSDRVTERRKHHGHGHGKIVGDDNDNDKDFLFADGLVGEHHVIVV